MASQRFDLDWRLLKNRLLMPGDDDSVEDVVVATLTDLINDDLASVIVRLSDRSSTGSTLARGRARWLTAMEHTLAQLIDQGGTAAAPDVMQDVEQV